MPTAAVIGGAQLGGAIISANAAQSAARAQARAAQQARADMQPFMIPGQGAMASLAQLYGINPQTGAADPNQAFSESSLEAFRRSPDYQFALREGLGALQNSQAAKGALRSGNTLRAITEYGQNYATQTLGNYRGALQQLASLGAGAAGGAGQASLQQGAAQASGMVGAGNAYAGALGSLGNYAMMQQQQQQQQTFLQNLMRPSSYGPPTAPPPVTTPPVPFYGIGASPY